MTTELYPAPTFPVSEPLKWQAPDKVELTPIQHDWLCFEGSLTQRLKSNCGHFEVRLLGQQEMLPHDEECRRLKQSQPAVVREVLLYCDGKPWVFARSIFAKSAENNEQLQLSELGNRSLGDSLFQREDLTSGPIEVATVAESHVIGKLNQQWFSQSKPLLGRRRIFSTAGEQLLVSEVFLTSSPLYDHVLEVQSK